MPPCHHWSWSSMYVASDHLTTVRRSVLAPGPDDVRDVELGGEVGVLADPDLAPLTRDDQHALGGTDVEHDPPARASPPARRTSRS